MNVQELIDELEKIEDKSLSVTYNDRYGMGGNCCSNEDYHYHYDYSTGEIEDIDSISRDSRLTFVGKKRVIENVIVLG